MTGQILIADGHATNRITLKVRLAAACYGIRTAATLGETLKAARNQRPDLILIGSGLADADQITLCGHLLADPDLSGIPLLVMCHGEARLAAMRAGATAVLDPTCDDLMLLARVRGLMRDSHTAGVNSGFAEAQATFCGPAASARPRGLPRIGLIAATPARALGWKHSLAPHLPYVLNIRDAEQALAEVAGGQAADLYLIAADLEQHGEGLRLMSELRSRPISQSAVFVIAIETGRSDLSAFALDLGAADTLPLDLARPFMTEMAVLAISTQLDRKQIADQQRYETRQNLAWAMTDPLTGLYNRRYALPRLTEAVRIAVHRGSALSILAMDLDRFKQINDGHGHAAGDAVLRAVAGRLEETVNGAGLLARMGGEEFLTILTDTDQDTAAQKAEALRRAVMATPVELPWAVGGGSLFVTISIGVVSLAGADRRSDATNLAESLLDRADRAMLRAKACGRNQVMVSQQDIAA